MTYNVFGGTVNLTLSINRLCLFVIFFFCSVLSVFLSPWTFVVQNTREDEDDDDDDDDDDDTNN